MPTPRAMHAFGGGTLRAVAHLPKKAAATTRRGLRKGHKRAAEAAAMALRIALQQIVMDEEAQMAAERLRLGDQWGGGRVSNITPIPDTDLSVWGGVLWLTSCVLGCVGSAHDDSH